MGDIHRRSGELMNYCVDMSGSDCVTESSTGPLSKDNFSASD